MSPELNGCLESECGLEWQDLQILSVFICGGGGLDVTFTKVEDPEGVLWSGINPQGIGFGYRYVHYHRRD